MNTFGRERRVDRQQKLATEPTICAKCRHHHNKQDGPRTKCMYNWFCRHPKMERPVAKNWVTGDNGYQTKNDLGKRIVVEEAFPYCCDINDGECKLFSL